MIGSRQSFHERGSPLAIVTLGIDLARMYSLCMVLTSLAKRF